MNTAKKRFTLSIFSFLCISFLSPTYADYEAGEVQLSGGSLVFVTNGTTYKTFGEAKSDEFSDYCTSVSGSLEKGTLCKDVLIDTGSNGQGGDYSCFIDYELDSEYTRSVNIAGLDIHFISTKRVTVADITVVNPGNDPEPCFIDAAPVIVQLTCDSPGDCLTPEEERRNYGNTQDFCSVGNPINPATGNKFQQEIDIVSSAPGFLLNYSRMYNSKDFTLGDHGIGWRTPYENNVSYYPNDDDGEKAIISRPDGKLFTYVYNTSSSTWETSSSVIGTLTKDTNGWTFKNKDNETETYDIDGKLISITKLSGFTLTLDYSVNTPIGDSNPDTLDTITNSFGYILTLQRNSESLVNTVITSKGEEYSYSYDVQGRLEKITFPDETPGDLLDNPTKTYHYQNTNFPYALTGITDENNDRLMTWDYDIEGRAISSERGVLGSGIDKTGLVFNANGTTTVSNAFGYTKDYSFGTHDNVIKTESISGDKSEGCPAIAKSTFYNGFGYVDERIFFNDSVTNYTIGSDGLETVRIEAQGQPEQRTITTVWESANRLPDTISQGDRIIDFDYYPNGQLEKRSVTNTLTSETRTTRYTYTPEGLLDTINGPREDLIDITDFDYDTDGTLIKVTNAIGNVTEILSYDDNGRPLQIRDWNGNIIDLKYYPRGWLKEYKITDSINTSDVLITGYQYDKAGLLDVVTLPSGRILNYDYDEYQRLERITDNAGNYIFYMLDAMGNRNFEEVHDTSPTNSLRREVEREFNTLNQLAFLRSGLDPAEPEYWENGFTYTMNNEMDIATDGKGTQTKYVYDKLGRVKTISENFGGSLIRTSSYTYDQYDNLETVTDHKGNVTTYSNNPFGDVTQIDSPDTGITQMTAFDKAGNVKTKIDARLVQSDYQYDAQNNLTRIDFSDGSYQTFTHLPGLSDGLGNNEIGRLASSTVHMTARVGQDDVVENYRYDMMGNLKWQSRVIDGSYTNVTTYDYDEDSNLKQIIYPTGRQVDYQINNLGQVNGITTTVSGITETLISNVIYSPFGPIESYVLGNGITVDHILDEDYRLKSIQAQGAGGMVYDKSYIFDANSNITNITDAITSSKSYVHTYDQFNRLRRSVGDGYTSIFNFDKGDNHTYHRRIGLRFYFDPAIGNNKIPSYKHGSGPFEPVFPLPYDAAGNMVGLGPSAFYDASNRLKYVDQFGIEKAHYMYDAFNRRVFKKLNANPSIDFAYTYDNKYRLLAETGPTNNTIKEYIYLDSMPVAMFNHDIPNPNPLFYINDHLNTPHILTDTSQTIVWHEELEPYGYTPSSTSNLQNLRYPGHYWDEETGFNYNINRYYDPYIGRYITPDPIGLIGGLNSYTYSSNNPISNYDPFGLYESHWLLRTFVPGQVAWDNAITQYENGNYGLSIANAGAMVGEQIMTALTLGEYQAVRVGTQCAANTIASTTTRANVTQIRNSYLDQVDLLSGSVNSIRASGLNADETLRLLAPMRNQLKLELRSEGPWLAARLADIRNIVKYGNKAGPSADDLIKQYGNADRALEALGRTSPVVNRIVGSGK